MPENAQPASIWKRIRTWSIVALAVLAGILILQNTEDVDTRLLFVTVSMPRAALLATTLLIGFAVGVPLGYRWRGSGDARDSA